MRRALRLVIIGSSTAAGQGADPPEQAWAHRYGAYLKALHPASEIINLAQGGLQTFHLTPTDHRPPPARPLPDAARNISRALSFWPDAVIVQTPSNDAAAHYSAQEQLANFDLILAYAMRQGVPVWLCAPQPRNFSPEQRSIQRELLQAMRLRYGPLLIDAWAALADADDGLLPECDCGDGAHLNNEGHARVLQAVLRADLPGTLARADREPAFWTKHVPALADGLQRRPQFRQPPLSFLQALKVWTRLIRLPNLLILALALALPYWAVLQPAIEQGGRGPVLDVFRFAVLSLAVVLTAAAGYVLNDYCDSAIDALNRPDRVVVGRWLSPERVQRLYRMLWLLALSLGLWLGFWLGNGLVAAVFAGAALLLFLYARWLKCTPVVGNVAVSLLCGVVPLLPQIAERPHLEALTASDAGRMALLWPGLYGLLAFWSNLWREQVKDLEDVEGDAAGRCRTLPVWVGVPAAQKAAVGTGLLFSALIGGLLGWRAEAGSPVFALALSVALLALPAVFLVGLLYRATERRHFSQVSLGIKMLMLAGLLVFLLIK
jgi:4-hydroxybenzoate polyprenyltransferase